VSRRRHRLGGLGVRSWNCVFERYIVGAAVSRSKAGRSLADMLRAEILSVDRCSPSSVLTAQLAAANLPSVRRLQRVATD
jgi:hypothetical protein